VDMPPATGDIMLTLTSLRKDNVEAIVVTMPDRLSTAVAHRVLELLSGGGVATLGVLGNMVRGAENDRSPGVGPSRLAKEFGVPLLGLLPYDHSVSKAVEKGRIEVLLRTRFAKGLRKSMRDYFHGMEEDAPRVPG